jgi:uncharacterized secreted protein with C-terminal beta-propeller domain
MDDRFIIASMNESKSKEIADILGNRTARKILDYLADTNASESDISKNLNLPLSTVHYNVQKLLKNKIIDVKDFFWSEKGNKINIYTLARKPIIIAPKYYRGYETLKSILPAVIIGAVFLAAIFTVFYNYNPQDITNQIAGQGNLKKFSSYSELKDFIKQNSEAGYYNYGLRGMETTLAKSTDTGVAAPVASGTTAGESQNAGEFSTTNIQVEGVDEADIVKNDDKYIYAVSGSSIVIVDAFPAENAKIVSQINISGNIQEIFVNKDKLIVFGQEQERYYSVMGDIAVAKVGIMQPRYYNPESFVMIYDISDRSNPVLYNNISVNGNYLQSRMIGSYVYFIINQPVYNYDNIILPRITEAGSTKEVQASEIYYFDVPDESYIFSTITALDIDSNEISSRTFMIGYTQNIYVSKDNIYLTYMKRLSTRYYYEKLIDDAYIPVLPADLAGKAKEIRNSNSTYYTKIDEIGRILQDYSETLDVDARLKLQNDVQDRNEKLQQEIAKETDKTVMHRISVNKNEISHEAQGEVQGSVLNQFSMDEYNDYFRIATTSESWRTGEPSKNNLYVLDMNLNIKGNIENLAEGERIYSARFIQDRAYLVTFRQTDPLFVIDLKNPETPAVLGYLKVPGVSDYLHPYDENHIIGVGRDASEEGRITGMKLSLFDITNFSNPIEISKYIIGGKGTYSEALNDHKAFLFSKSKNLLVIPVTIYEEWKYEFNGAYVFNVDLTNGLQLKGNVTHQNESANKSEYYYPEWQNTVRRALYMDNVLYTISNKMIKANNLDSIEEINKIVLPYKEEPVIYY